MPRARNIKPGFFDNSELGRLHSDIRLLYISLWTLADREGVVECDYALIKRYAFGYKSDVSQEKISEYITVITRLDNGNSTLLKEHDGKLYLILLKFPAHQNPHHTEKKGRLPSIELLKSKDNINLTVRQPLSNAINPADSLIPDSLIPDSLIPDSRNQADYENEFLEFKKLYPLQGRGFGSNKDAKNKFIIARKKDSFDNIIKGVVKYTEYINKTGQSNKDAFRWLEKESWKDDYTIVNIGIQNENFNGNNRQFYPNSNQGASFNDKHQRTLEAAARGHARAQNPDF